METIIRLYLTNDPVKFHATWTLNDEDAISDADVLEAGKALSVPYATYEDDYWLLDGNYKFLPATDANVGYWSDALSDSDGVSVTAIGSIEINFDAEYDFDAITIRGCEHSGDYASRVLVEYFTDNVKVDEVEIYPNESVYTFSNAVEGIDEIHFTFFDTNNPYRRVRVSDIIFGDMMEFRAENVKSASVIFETSPLSTELPAGELKCNLYSDDPIFDMIDPDSLYSQLQERMMIDVLYDKGAQVDFIGRYYLANDGRKNISENEIHIEGKDLIGLWDDAPYNGDFWATDESFSVIINRILSFSTDVETVSIDEDIASIQLRGNIAPGNVRKAMQQALFAAGASMEVLEGNTVHVFHQRFLDINETPETTITRAEKALDDQSLTDSAPVTRIEVASHSYVMKATSSNIFKETLTGGTYVLYFERPAYFAQANVTNATLVSSGPNFAEISVTGTKEVTITGSEFNHNQIVSAQDIALSGVRPNTIKVIDATLISTDTVFTVLTRMQFYYLLRYQQQFRAFNPSFYRPGFVFQVDTIKDRKVSMIMSQTQIDLSSGFVCDFKGTGVIIGNELIQQKAITMIGDKGAVTPNQFEYPRTSPQSFSVVLFEDYYNDYGIEIDINGSKTLIGENSASFVVPSTNASTSVAIDFPVITRAIEYNASDFTITPTKFKLNKLGDQSISITSKKANPALYTIKITVDGVATSYDIGAKTLVISNTGADTTVKVEAVEKSKKYIEGTHDGSSTGYNVYWEYWLHYPVIGNQNVFISIVGFVNGQTADAKANFKIIRDGVTVASADGVSGLNCDIGNVNSSTIVSVDYRNCRLGSGGYSGGGSGGGGYTPWNASIQAGSVMRDSASPLGNFVASLGYGTSVQITNQSDNDQWLYGTIIQNDQYPNNVGLSGWVSVSIVLNLQNNPN